MFSPAAFPLASLGAFITAYSQSDWFGKLVILGLVALSMISWIVLLHKVWMIRKVRYISQAFHKAFEQNQEAMLSLEVGNLPKPRQAGLRHPFANLLQTTQKKTREILGKNKYFLTQDGKVKAPVYLTPSDIELLESHLAATISSESKELEKNVFILSTIVTLAPFMGLLGTVWGILISFSGLHAGGSAGSNSAILGGLSTALATTVLGLIIAIPALIAYNYLRSTLKDYTSEMDDFSTSLLSTVEIQYRKVE
ncbi:MAG: MotA/TolQ/ExbB proton channel family protein [Verrucomicrobia bacterium]|nr:MotA/TolQ/ExbB proton channel family protein [Verrucomicrobiota bacterium]